MQHLSISWPQAFWRLRGCRSVGIDVSKSMSPGVDGMACVVSSVRVLLRPCLCVCSCIHPTRSARELVRTNVCLLVNELLEVAPFIALWLLAIASGSAGDSNEVVRDRTSGGKRAFARTRQGMYRSRARTTSSMCVAVWPQGGSVCVAAPSGLRRHRQWVAEPRG